MDDHNLDGILIRVERLERERRLWRLGALAVAVVALTVAAKPKSTTLEGEKLVITDAKGTVRAVLGSEIAARGWPQMPPLPSAQPSPTPAPQFGLYVYDEAGKEVARLNLDEGDPQLILSDHELKAFVSVGVVHGMSNVEVRRAATGLAELATSAAAVVERAQRENWVASDKRWAEAAPKAEEASAALSVSPTGNFLVEGLGKSGRVQLTGGALPPSVSVLGPKLLSGIDIIPDELRLRDQTGKARLRLALGVGDAPFVVLHDRDGHVRALVGQPAIETGKSGAGDLAESSLALFDRAGKLLWSAP